MIKKYKEYNISKTNNESVDNKNVSDIEKEIVQNKKRDPQRIGLDLTKNLPNIIDMI